MKYTFIIICALWLAGCEAPNSGPAATTACEEDSVSKIKLIDRLSRDNDRMSRQMDEWKAGKAYANRTRDKDDSAAVDKDRARLAADKEKLESDRGQLHGDKSKVNRDNGK